MQWIEPKIDWMIKIDENGKYIGDYFNVLDFNRIKSNIEFLATKAQQFWPVFVRAMPDRKYEEYPYADEINTLAENLETINIFTGCEIGQKTVYTANGAFIGFEDLNRLETACLKIYEAMQDLYTKPVKLPIRLGSKYYALKNPKISLRKTRLPLKLSIRFGGTYYPHKIPNISRIETKCKKLPIKLGSEYFPFKK